jgi:hypothetical protein
MRKFIFLFVVLLLMGVWIYGLVYSAGTTSNTHFRQDPLHQSYNDFTRLYEVRLDSGISWGTAADSNRLAATWYTTWRDLGKRIAFMYIFRMTRIDTTYTIDDNDSILVTIQTSSNPWVWNSKTNDIHAALLLDTGTVAKYFPACSALVQVQTPYVRTSVYYTCWQDSLANGSITDTKTHVPMTFEETIIPVGE